MQRHVYFVMFVCSLFGQALAEEGKSADGDKPEEKVTYVDHVLPIFRARCGSCHNPNDRRGGLVLDQYAGMMEGGSSGEVVSAGDSANSYLWLLVNHESTPQMPPESEKLPENELAVIKKWIDLGALETSGSVANIKKKSSLAKIEVSTDRPAEVAMPERYLGEPAHVLTSKNAVTALATSPWASLVAVSGHEQVALYNSATLEPLGVLPFPEGQPQIIKFSRNGSLLIVGGGRGGQLGKVVVFDVKTGQRKVEIGNEYDQVLAADISADQSLVALGGPKKMLRVYSTATGELVYENKKHTDWVTAIEFSPDGVLLASADRSNGLVIWEADTGRLFYDLQGHTGAINDVSWRPDSNVLGSASEDGSIKLWEMQNGGNIKSWGAHGGGTQSLEYTREGNLVSVGRDKVARSWNGDGGKLKDFGGLADIGMEIAYDAESKRVISGGWDGMIHFWNSEDAQKVGEINTNPPTAANYLAILEPKLQQARELHAVKAKALAGLTSMLAARQTAANEALAATQAANETVNSLNTQVAQLTTQLKEKQTTLTSTTEQLLQAKTVLDQAIATRTQAEQALQPVRTALEQQSAKVVQLTAAAKAAQEGVSKATETLQILAKAAEPTPEETALIEKNPEVKAALAKRTEVTKAAEATVTVATIVATQAAEQLRIGQSSQASVQQSFNSADAALKAAAAAADTAQKSHDTVAQAQVAAKAQVDAAEKAVAEMQQKLTDAQTVAAQAKTKSDQLTAAAQPTEAEQSQLQAAQAETVQAQQQLQILEEQFKRLESVQDQVATASTESKDAQ